MSESQKKLAFFLPNLFTALNLACGLLSVLFAVDQRFYLSAMILVLGAIFDSVDGRIARYMGTESQFGEQFDSMSDLISFGMAPCLLFYFCFLKDLGRLGIVCTFIFLLCSALRLARFNTNTHLVGKNFFQGLPTPAASLALIGLVLINKEWPLLNEFSYGLCAYLTMISLLMISSFPFPSFKNSLMVKKRKRLTFLVIAMIFVLIGLYEEVMIAAVFNLYILGAVIFYLIRRKEFRGLFDFEQEGEV